MATTITNAGDLIEPLKRAVAAPGGYDDAFPNGDDDTLFAYITDAFSEARIDRFFPLNTVDWVTGDFNPILSQGDGYLVVLYAAINILGTQLRNMGTSNTYKAGPVEYSTTNSATVIKGALDALQARKLQLIKYRGAGSGTPWFGDAYWGRLSHGVDQGEAFWMRWNTLYFPGSGYPADALGW